MFRLQKAGNWLRDEVREFEPGTILASLGMLSAAAVLTFMPSAREAVATDLEYAVEAVIDTGGNRAPEPLSQEEFTFVGEGAKLANEVERAAELPDCVVLPGSLC